MSQDYSVRHERSQEGGIIALNLSNRALDLKEAATAAALGDS